MNKTDKELSTKISKGDENAFEELIMLYGGLIKSIVRYHLRLIPMWQDDCINEILLKIWQNINRYNPNKSSLKSWIGAVAKYHAIDYKRKYYNMLTSEELTETISAPNTVESSILMQELREEINSLLSSLPPQDKKLFESLFIDKQSVNEVSHATGKSPSWIYNRVSRGRKKLKKIFMNERS